MRYAPEGTEDLDGLPGGEGAFLPWSFWLADNLWLIRSSSIWIASTVPIARSSVAGRNPTSGIIRRLARAGRSIEEWDGRRAAGYAPPRDTSRALVHDHSRLKPLTRYT